MTINDMTINEPAYKILINKILKEKLSFKFTADDNIIYTKIDNFILKLIFNKKTIEIKFQIELPEKYIYDLEIINLILIQYKYSFINQKSIYIIKKFNSNYGNEEVAKNYNNIIKYIKLEIINIEPIINFLKIFTNKSYKFSSINLKQINQFKNLEINLTYPKGHDKAGEALDKVCIIGQNGTGKTSILKIIKEFIERKNNNAIFSNINSDIELTFLKDKIPIKLSFKQNKFTFSNNLIDTDNKLLNIPELDILRKNYINFPADIIDKPKNQQTVVPKIGIIDFDILSAQKTWDFVKQEIIEYNKKEQVEREKLGRIEKIRKIESAENIKKISDKLTADFVNWKQKNPSPVKKLADECLDRFLKKFQLRVKTKLNFGNETDINSIKIENLQGEELGNLETMLSTGTKQILYTAMPLYSLQPENTIVLFDEPERSLYPDIQKDIIDFYTSLSPKSQFFFATHSPIIASCFEPWEIIELRFNNKTGKVKQETWFDGERHIDNYYKDARLLKWDSILMDIYGLTEEGNEKIRNKEISKAHRLKRQLEDLTTQDKTKTNEYKNKQEKFIHIAKKLGWDLEINNKM